MISVRSRVFLTLIIISGSKAQVVFDNPPSGGETRTIAENISPSTSLYGLQATDLAGNTPSFSIATSQCVSTPQPSSIPTFTISSSDQLLVPTVGLDAETCTQFEFTFSVTAGSNTAISDTLILIVTDVNDVDPRFTNASYNGEVWKNDQQNQIVNANDLVSATDPDRTNLSIIYSIAGAQTTFAIYDNGSVYIQTPSGLAPLSSPTILTIQASDGGRTSTASLIIIVHDDPCTVSPCQNGGTCMTDSGDRGSYECNCQSGYTGSNCLQVNYCLGDRCNGNGNCTNQINGYKCTCTKYPFLSNDAMNQNCTYEDRCINESHVCNNRGICSNVNKTFKCDCFKPWYTGETCNKTKECFIVGICSTSVSVLVIIVANVCFCCCPSWLHKPIFFTRPRRIKECHCDKVQETELYEDCDSTTKKAGL